MRQEARAIHILRVRRKLSDGLNPVIYAFGLPGFKQALRQNCLSSHLSITTNFATSHYSPTFTLRRGDSNQTSTRLRVLNTPHSARSSTS